MNKRLLKYLLKGVIALGTAGFLNGISVSFLELEETQVPPSSKTVDTTTSKLVNDNTATSMPKVALTDLHMSPQVTDLPMPQALDCLANLATDQKPKNELDAPKTDNLEEDADDLIEPTDAQKNQLIVGKMLSTGNAPEKIDCAEKHKKNYQLPRIYTTNNCPIKTKQDIKIQDAQGPKNLSEDLYSSSEKDWSDGCGSDDCYKSMGGNSRHSDSPDDEMLNQLVRLMEQENRNNNPSQSYSGNSAPQNFGSTANYCPTQDSKGTSSAKKLADKTADKNDTKPTDTPTTETLTNGLLPIADEKDDQEDTDDTDKAAKKLKKKNKKKELEAQELAKKLATTEINKKDQTLSNIQKSDDKKSTEPAKNDNEKTISFEQVSELTQKLAEAINSFLAGQTVFDQKLSDDLLSAATKWITENKKNIVNEKTQQDLKNYKSFLEQQCTAFDNIIETIKKQEIPEDKKAAACVTYTNLKSIYQNILKAYDDNTENKEVSPEPEPKNAPESGIWENFKKEPLKTTIAFGAIGVGAWLIGSLAKDLITKADSNKK